MKRIITVAVSISLFFTASVSKASSVDIVKMKEQGYKIVENAFPGGFDEFYEKGIYFFSTESSEIIFGMKSDEDKDKLRTFIDEEYPGLKENLIIEKVKYSDKEIESKIMEIKKEIESKKQIDKVFIIDKDNKNQGIIVISSGLNPELIKDLENKYSDIININDGELNIRQDLNSTKYISIKDMKRDDWYFTPIIELYRKGIISGYPDGTMRPDDNITREEAAVTISNIVENKEVNENDEQSFEDVELGRWSEKAIYTLKSLKLVSGTGDNKFSPEDNLKREEGAVLLANLYGHRGMEIKPSDNEYTDAEEISDWAKEAVLNDVIKGYPDGSFRAQESITRGEFFQLINTFCNEVDTLERNRYTNHSGYQDMLNEMLETEKENVKIIDEKIAEIDRNRETLIKNEDIDNLVNFEKKLRLLSDIQSVKSYLTLLDLKEDGQKSNLANIFSAKEKKCLSKVTLSPVLSICYSDYYSWILNNGVNTDVLKGSLRYGDKMDKILDEHVEFLNYAKMSIQEYIKVIEGELNGDFYNIPPKLFFQF